MSAYKSEVRELHVVELCVLKNILYVLCAHVHCETVKVYNKKIDYK